MDQVWARTISLSRAGAAPRSMVALFVDETADAGQKQSMLGLGIREIILTAIIGQDMVWVQIREPSQICSKARRFRDSC